MFFFSALRDFFDIASALHALIKKAVCRRLGRGLVALVLRNGFR
jgi:hypothetical protein